MRDKNAPHSAAIKETEVHTAKKDDTIGRGEKESGGLGGRETRERFYRPLMLFHPLPLFCGRNTKNLTFPSSASFPPPTSPADPPVLTLQSFRSLPCHVPFFLLRFSRNIPTERTLRRSSFLVTSSYNWNLRTTGTDRLPVIWKG